MVGFLCRLKLFCMVRLSFLTSIFKKSKLYYNIVHCRNVLYYICISLVLNQENLRLPVNEFLKKYFHYKVLEYYTNTNIESGKPQQHVSKFQNWWYQKFELLLENSRKQNLWDYDCLMTILNVFIRLYLCHNVYLAGAITRYIVKAVSIMKEAIS